MCLTDMSIRNLKPKDKLYKISDTGGLYLLVKPKGSRLWRMDYRFNSTRKTLSFGPYPLTSLAEAREKRDLAKKQLANGVDPGHQRKLDKLATAVRAGNTFHIIAEELLEKLTREDRAPTTLQKKKWLLEFADPYIGDRPISEISALELLVMLRSVEARGRYQTARRLRSTCGRVFRYAIATGRAERDPSMDLRGALVTPRTRHRAAIVEPNAIGALLRAIDGYEGNLIIRMALQFLALTFVRPGEIRHAEWVEFDLDTAIWTLPAHKMKMRRPHRVPLSRQALAIVQDLQLLTGKGKYLFPSGRKVQKPIFENALNAALRRLGYGSDEVSAHGFRAMAATRLNEMGRWSGDAIERQLAHQEANQVRRAYTHAAEFWSDRVAMMQTWADYLDELRSRVQVVPLRGNQFG